MKRPYIFKESIVSTIMTLVITFFLSFIPLRNDFLKPIRQGFLGFDIYDLKYAGKNLSNRGRDTNNIVIVEIAGNREMIAEQLNIIQNDSPKVIGVDAIFADTTVTAGSKKLLEAISKPGNIIFAIKYNKNDTTGQESFTRNFFDDKHHPHQSGFINFLGNQYSVIRDYAPFLKIVDSVSAFTSALLKKISPAKYDELKGRKNELEIINYTGNLESYTCLSAEQLEYLQSTGELRNYLYNKIVLLGYIHKEEPLIMEDLHFTPLNEEIAGKSFPDMYGVMIHANILSMLLNRSYATLAPVYVSYLLAAVFTFLFLFFILSQHTKKKPVNHLWFLPAQVIIIILLMYLFLLLFNFFLLKITLLPILMSLVLCVELLELYKVIALKLHKKYGYLTVFTHKHIK